MRSSTTVLSCGSVRIDRLDPRLGPDRKGTSDCADEVTLSRKGAKSPARIPGLRSTGTKAKTHTGRVRDLEQQLEACRRELAESQEHLAEALEIADALFSRQLCDHMLRGGQRLGPAPFGTRQCKCRRPRGRRRSNSTSQAYTTRSRRLSS